MSLNGKPLHALIASAGIAILLLPIRVTNAQVTRYQPSTPTVSPYLNLYQNSRRGPANAAANYYNLVRPMQRQIQTNQAQQKFEQQQSQTDQIQQQFVQQQAETIEQLQTNVRLLKEGRQNGQPVPTGHDSWFENPGTRSRFLNTSSYYSRVGTVVTGTRR